MKKNDWGIEITKVGHGFLIKDNNGNRTVIEEKEGNEIAAAEELLWWIIDFFNLRGNKYDQERLAIIRETGNKYIPEKEA